MPHGLSEPYKEGLGSRSFGTLGCRYEVFAILKGFRSSCQTLRAPGVWVFGFVICVTPNLNKAVREQNLNPKLPESLIKQKKRLKVPLKKPFQEAHMEPPLSPKP